MTFDPTIPEPGDVWTREGFGTLTVVSVAKGKVTIEGRKGPCETLLPEFSQMAAASLDLGATVVRRGKTWSKEIEEFEV